MKKVILFAFSWSVLMSVVSQTLPSKAEVLQKMELANNYFMTKWSDPTTNIVTNKTRPSNLWTRGTYYEGLMQLYYINGNSNLLKYAIDWGTYHKWQPTYVGTATTRIADNQCCGQTYLELFQLDNSKSERISTMQASIDAMVNSTKKNDWWWIDALHMAMPVFAKFGVINNNASYFEKMYDLYNYTKTEAKGVGLYNTSDSLWYRDSVYLPPKKTTNNLPVYWSRGNGWVFAALTRTLDVLPQSASHRDEYITTFRQMAKKLIRIQRSDGFWNCNLGDPNDYGGKESSGTVFFAYGLAWGINQNILDSATYYSSVVKAWTGLVNNALHTDGAIGYMQSSGSKPADGQPLSYDKMPDFEDFGLGGFLLAGSEIYKLAKIQTTGLNSLEKETSNLEAYPNPFSDVFTLKIPDGFENGLLEIFDLSGKSVYSKKIKNGNTKITLNNADLASINMEKGVFVLKLSNDKCYKTLSVVKN